MGIALTRFAGVRLPRPRAYGRSNTCGPRGEMFGADQRPRLPYGPASEELTAGWRIWRATPCAKEFGPRRITANVVSPGTIPTDFSGGMVQPIEVFGGMSL